MWCCIKSYLCFFAPTLIIFAIRQLFFKRRLTRGSIGFFHPYCNAGGGGERVLFCAVKMLLERYPKHEVVIYTGDVGISESQILDDAYSRFGVRIPLNSVRFIYLKSRRLLEPDLYPVFTLLGQTLAGVFVGLEAALRYVPEVFIDSMGCPMTLPLFSLVCGSKAVSYVHYPVISTDMIDLVAQRTSTYNNSGFVSRNPTLSAMKLHYYRLFAKFYGLIGSASHLNMVNGSWTAGHIRRLWNQPSITHLVYPPCDVSHFRRIVNQSEALMLEENTVRIISVAQFRPEKNHALQLRAIRKVVKRLQSDGSNLNVKLTCVGGCRNEADSQRVRVLEDLAVELNIEDNVEFCVNVPFKELCQKMSMSMIGLHTMYNEHFGIGWLGVVEIMASGTIVVAHDSGGPKMDIVVPANDDPDATGMLAETEDQYADRILRVIAMDAAERDRIRLAAKQRASQFSDETFADAFEAACKSIDLFSLS